MNIAIYQLIEGAKMARGLTVIIDVFRAFTLACYAFHNGAKSIIPVGDLELAYRLKEANPDYLLMGERKGRKPPGFDFDNSPAHIEHVNLEGKTLVHTTSAGTQGIANAVKADEIISGSFVNAKAIAAYIQKQNPEYVSLVCMGNEALSPADEDTLCAQYIESLLLNTSFSLDTVSPILKEGNGRRFFNPENASWSPERDFHMALDFNRFDFVLKAVRQPEGFCRFEKIITNI